MSSFVFSRDFTSRLVSPLQRNRSALRLVVITLLLLTVFTIFSPVPFLGVINFQSMGFQVAEVSLLSLAMMLSMLTGGIDLSVVSIMNLSAIMTAKLLAANHVPAGSWGPLLLCIAAGVGLGAVCGALNGLLITRARITPILATLGTMQLLNGVAIIWTRGASVLVSQDDFINIGNGTIAGIPIPFAILLVTSLAVALLINRTALGMRLTLVGANPTAARFSGLDNNRVLLVTYVTSGFLAAVAGIVIASRSASANPDYGATYILLAIVIVVLGGVNPYGGYATVGGVVLAAICLQIVGSGFNFMRFSLFAYEIAQGLIVIGVLVIDALSDRGILKFPQRRRRRRSGNVAGSTAEEEEDPVAAE